MAGVIGKGHITGFEKSIDTVKWSPRNMGLKTKETHAFSFYMGAFFASKTSTSAPDTKGFKSI